MVLWPRRSGGVAGRFPNAVRASLLGGEHREKRLEEQPPFRSARKSFGPRRFLFWRKKRFWWPRSPKTLLRMGGIFARLSEWVDILEVRGDLVEAKPRFLREHFAGRLLFTYRSRAEGGRGAVSPRKRIDRILSEAPHYDLVDLESTPRPPFGSTQTIFPPRAESFPGTAELPVSRIFAAASTPWWTRRRHSTNWFPWPNRVVKNLHLWLYCIPWGGKM